MLFLVQTVMHMNFLRRANRLVSGAVVAVSLFLGSSAANGGVSVHPTEIFVKPPARSAPVVITNPSDKETEVWVSFSYGYPVTFDSGGVTMSKGDTISPDEPSAQKWLRAIPQRFTLKPQETQVVRIYSTPPPGLPSGEYWARVVVNSKTRKPVVQKDQGGARLNMELITQTDVPFHFRSGATNTGIILREANAEAVSKGIRMKLVFDRSGNAAYWGRMTTRLINAAGKVVKTKESRLVVYKTLDYEFEIDTQGEAPGQYAIEMTFDNRHPGVSPEFRIPTQALVQRIPVVIP